MKKPISQATLAILVSSIKENHAAFDAGKDSSVFHAGRVMEVMTKIMEAGHVITLSIWPMGYATQIWEVAIDDVHIVKGAVLMDEDGIQKLLNRKKR